jgi:serine/threonine protein kinase/TolB-like protein
LTSVFDLPGFHITRELGRGGMATVYVAEQTSLGREVALKVLDPQLAADPSSTERLLREARTVASLHHPHIVAIYDVGLHQGMQYIAMEYLPLGAIAATGEQLTPREVLRCVREIASALDYAHAHGIVHRDVKPSNILRHEHGNYLLADFGIARVNNTGATITGAGSVIGTPAYMSPEQWRGGQLDGRADLYSLGIVLYELLTGAVPYVGDDQWAVGMQHMNAVTPELPAPYRGLQGLLARMLAKQPADRVATGAEVVAQIEAIEREGGFADARTTPVPLSSANTSQPSRSNSQQAATRISGPLPEPGVSMDGSSAAYVAQTAPSFFSELKRRNVLRVGAFYAVVAWLLVQVATQVLPIFGVSALAQRIMVLIVIASFPLVLALSWIYEITPQGIVKSNAVAPNESIVQRTGQKLNFVIIAVLGLAVVFLLAQRFWLPQKAAEAATTISDKSVAVLPFENLSDDKANAYFAEGIQDEILTRLAKIGALKVISRTSTQHYASSPDNLPEIAKQLGVANILEGTVQKVGDAVHINVQLIRAATDDHLWAEIYNRKLDDIFAVEGEVAGAIADKLNAKLSGAEQEAVAKKPTENLAAYDFYLRGLALADSGYDYATTRKAIAAYSEAVRLDPKFAFAWARLGMAASYLYFNNVDADKYTPQFVKNAADTALQLQPQSSEAQLAQGDYLYRVMRDFSGAQKAFETILQRSPNDKAALQYLGLVERRQGKWERALVHLKQAAELDPRDAGLMTTIGAETFGNMHRFDKALQWLDRAAALAPGDAQIIPYQASAYQAMGRLADAAHILDPVPSAGIDPLAAYFRGYQRLLERRFTTAIAELQPVLARPEATLDGFGPQLTLYLGDAQQLAGQKAAAQATFERLITQIEPMSAQVDDSLLPVILGLAYAHAGRQKAALDQAARAVQLYANDAIWRPVAEWGLAEVQTIGGDHAAAIATLRRILGVPAGPTVAQLRLEPTWDPLRGDPAFDALLKEHVDDGKGSGPQ